MLDNVKYFGYPHFRSFTALDSLLLYFPIFNAKILIPTVLLQLNKRKRLRYAVFELSVRLFPLSNRNLHMKGSYRDLNI